MRIDLHTHTTASDGSDSPSKLIQNAALAGLSTIAVTDHDTVAGLAEAAREAARAGIAFVGGLEWSVENRQEMHMLCYALDTNSPVLQKALRSVNRARDQRNPRIVERLRDAGLNISMGEVEDVAGGMIGRPHIAAVLVRRGYARDVNEAFRRFLARGRVGYVFKEKISEDDCFRVIQSAGGVAVLAHPKTLGLPLATLENRLRQLKEKGLQGIETYYPAHSESDRAALLAMARRLDLLTTGGSDYHGLPKPDIHLGDGCRGECPGLDEAAAYLLLKQKETGAK